MEGLEKRCFLDVLRAKYLKVGKKGKGAILEEVVGKLSVSRKHAIKLMRPLEVGRPRKLSKGGRPSKYKNNREFLNALKVLWRVMKHPCGKFLKAGIADWLYVVAEEYRFSENVVVLLSEVSASTMDRLLRRVKVTKGLSATRSGGFRDEIPFQGNIWNIEFPGHTEFDTVAHCGGSLMGEYINSVVGTDIATTWTEARTTFGRGSSGVFECIKDMEKSFPFPIIGYDADNGGEVLNHMVSQYFTTERIKEGKPPAQVTRARPYQKNDNAHVEQKNDSFARRYLGYGRMDFIELLPLTNYYYRDILCPLMNHFMPSLKLQDKQRINHKTKRIYGAPMSPYKRVMASEYIPQKTKDALKLKHESLNPLHLSKLEVEVRTKINSTITKLKLGEDVAPLIRVPNSFNPLQLYRSF